MLISTNCTDSSTSGHILLWINTKWVWLQKEAALTPPHAPVTIAYFVTSRCRLGNFLPHSCGSDNNHNFWVWFPNSLSHRKLEMQYLCFEQSLLAPVLGIPSKLPLSPPPSRERPSGWETFPKENLIDGKKTSAEQEKRCAVVSHMSHNRNSDLWVMILMTRRLKYSPKETHLNMVTICVLKY